ncbi:hypothetical protein SY94_4515 [Agrobacterium tumefaciens]|nr:hypothetical protein SY94_4515 [Agrobacterium tumefaciens]
MAAKAAIAKCLFMSFSSKNLLKRTGCALSRISRCHGFPAKSYPFAAKENPRRQATLK